MGVKPVIDAQKKSIVPLFLKRYPEKHPLPKNFCTRDFWRTRLNLNGWFTQLAMEELRTETGDDSYKFIIRLPYRYKLMKQMLKKP